MTRPHTAPGHSLGISNGWSGVGDRITVWCGYCRDEFTPDEEWVRRFYDTRRHRLRMTDPDYIMGGLEVALARVAEDEAALLRSLSAALAPGAAS